MTLQRQGEIVFPSLVTGSSLFLCGSSAVLWVWPSTAQSKRCFWPGLGAFSVQRRCVWHTCGDTCNRWIRQSGMLKYWCWDVRVAWWIVHHYLGHSWTRQSHNHVWTSATRTSCQRDGESCHEFSSDVLGVNCRWFRAMDLCMFMFLRGGYFPFILT